MKLKKLWIISLTLLMLLSGCSSEPGEESSAISDDTSSILSSGLSSGQMSSEEDGEGLTESSLPSSSTPSSSSASSATSSTSSTDLFPETSSLSPTAGTDTAFTFQDGVYTKVTGTNALFVVAKDLSNITDEKARSKEEKNLAQKTMEKYYNEGYYCVVAIVKPDADNTVDLEKTRDNFTMRVVKKQKASGDISTITSPTLQKESIASYMDGQAK